MSSSRVQEVVAVSAQELLSFNDDRFNQFVHSCRTSSSDFDLSCVRALDCLSIGQRVDLSEKLGTVATRADTINADQLLNLLCTIATQGMSSHVRQLQSRDTQLPISIPAVGNNIAEAVCYDELARTGGRPMVPLNVFFEFSKDTQVARRMFGLWLDDSDTGDRDGKVPPLFSTQLEDWMSFRHKWQWDNRGKYASAEGFAGFLDAKKKKYRHKREFEILSDNMFERLVVESWKNESRDLELSGKRGFTAYGIAVKDRLLAHEFPHGFQLDEDPRKQDAWTTWVEYLGCNYWKMDQLVLVVKAAKLQYLTAWDDLKSFEASPPSFASKTSGRYNDDIERTREMRKALRDRVRRFIQATKVFQREASRFHRQASRAQWALEQLSLIEKVPSPAQ